MAHIQPINIPFQGTANFLLITTLSYALGVDDTTGVHWQLMEESYVEGKPEYKSMSASGTIALTKEQFSMWGTDDNYIISLVANSIGVQLLSDTYSSTEVPATEEVVKSGNFLTRLLGL